MMVGTMDSHGPGWWAHGQANDAGEVALYQLWAPNERRAQWAASWRSPEGDDGGFARGDTAGDALVVMPPTTEGQRARQALLKAATDTEALR
jgi:hypothetical protein